MKTVIAIATSLSFVVGCAIDFDDSDEEPAYEDIEQASICGSTNDLQHVNSYNGTLGPSISLHEPGVLYFTSEHADGRGRADIYRIEYEWASDEDPDEAEGDARAGAVRGPAGTDLRAGHP